MCVYCTAQDVMPEAVALRKIAAGLLEDRLHQTLSLPLPRPVPYPRVSAMMVSPNGDTLFTGSFDKCLHLTLSLSLHLTLSLSLSLSLH